MLLKVIWKHLHQLVQAIRSGQQNMLSFDALLDQCIAMHGMGVSMDSEIPLLWLLICLKVLPCQSVFCCSCRIPRTLLQKICHFCSTDIWICFLFCISVFLNNKDSDTDLCCQKYSPVNCLFFHLGYSTTSFVKVCHFCSTDIWIYSDMSIQYFYLTTRRAVILIFFCESTVLSIGFLLQLGYSQNFSAKICHCAGLNKLVQVHNWSKV